MDHRRTMRPSSQARRTGSKAPQESVSPYSNGNNRACFSSSTTVRLQTEARGPVQRIAPEQKEATPATSPEVPETPHPQTTVDPVGGTSWSPVQVQPTTSPYGNGSANTSSSLSVVVSPPDNHPHHSRHNSRNLQTGNEFLGTPAPVLSHRHQYWDGSQPTPSATGSEHDNITIQEACLLKHFIDKLSHWVRTLHILKSTTHLMYSLSSTHATPVEASNSSSPNAPANTPPSSTPSTPSLHATSAANSSPRGASSSKASSYPHSPQAPRWSTC